jgi:hypothetical protein
MSPYRQGLVIQSQTLPIHIYLASGRGHIFLYTGGKIWLKPYNKSMTLVCGEADSMTGKTGTLVIRDLRNDIHRQGV